VLYRLATVRMFCAEEDMMSRRTLSRRDALGVIGKTGAALGAGICFFLGLKTSPLLAGTGDAPAPGKGQAKSPPGKIVSPVAEKVVVSGAGSKLFFKISGRAGRRCGVSFATADAREQYRAASSARHLIGQNGLATIEVDVKGLPNGKVYLRVVTGASGEFSRDLRGTQAFEVTINNGVITMFGGVRERPLENTTAAVATAASGYNSMIR
jgi:hypothetical protein